MQKHFSSSALDEAHRHLLARLKLNTLQGLAFLDVGCGSGIHSLAALQAGAAKVVSFDYDPNSVSTTEMLFAQAGKPAHWKILQGSVLDSAFMQSLGSFDVVYSWGVLHHTGAMQKALHNARIPLSKNGVLYIALYSYLGYESGKIIGWPSPEEWLEIKKQYNKGTPFRRKMMELHQLWRSSRCAHAKSAKEGVNNIIKLIKKINSYSKDQRGMNYWTDLRDWLGGWPMEFMNENECITFCKKNLALDIVSIKTGEGNTEYVFRPIGASNYWDQILAKREFFPLNGPFHHEAGHMWSALIEEDNFLPDTMEKPLQSPLTLCENGIPLSYAHALDESIAVLGEGRYRHRNGKMFFSTRDNSDPNMLVDAFSYYVD